MLRFELLRLSKSDHVTMKLFREVFRAINVRMPMAEQKVFQEFLMLPSQQESKATFGKSLLDLGKLRQVIEAFAKSHCDTFANAVTVDPETRAQQMRSMAKMARSGMEKLLEDLVTKLRVNFGNISDAYRFFDLSGCQRCTAEHFVFNSAFFDLDFEYVDAADLFAALDP